MTQICYYGDKLSPNIAKTPEGFLICKNVPIARTGYQQYLGSELEEDGSPSELISVYRSPKEVFSAATLASFEGKPVTNGHPHVDVTSDNYKQFAKGHVQHVRIGQGDDADKIVADLYITDKALIDEIMSGKREVSAGYYAEDMKEDSGQICQTKIRGNHVAIVDEGRAGHSVAIRDAKHSIEGVNGMKRKEKVAKIVARFLMDESAGDIDERLSQAAEVLDEELSKKDEDACAFEPKKDEDVEEFDLFDKEEKEDAEPSKKCDGDVAIWDEIDSINSRLDALEAKVHKDEDVDADVDLNTEIAEDGDLDDDDENEVIASSFGDSDVEDEDEDEDDVSIIGIDDEDKKMDKCSTKDAAIRALSRVAMGLKDRRERQRMQDAILRVAGGKSQMSGLMSLVKSNQVKRDASASKNINTDALQKIYDKLNPHKAK